METIIKLSPSELNNNLLDKIKSYIGSRKDIDITISLKELDAKYAEDLDISIEQAEQGKNLISFTMEDFMEYIPSKK